MIVLMEKSKGEIFIFGHTFINDAGDVYCKLYSEHCKLYSEHGGIFPIYWESMENMFELIGWL